jgi:hypothetical protein
MFSTSTDILKEELTNESSIATVTEGFPSAFYRTIQKQLTALEGAQLWLQLTSGCVDEREIKDIVMKLDAVDVSTMSHSMRREISYSLLFPSVFPKPKIMVQSYFSDYQIMRWVMSVLPAGSSGAVYDEWTPSLLPDGACQVVSAEDRDELLDTFSSYWVAAEVVIRGEFKTLVVQLPTCYTSRQSRETLLADMRTILGPIYRKELYEVSGLLDF